MTLHIRKGDTEHEAFVRFSGHSIQGSHAPIPFDGTEIMLQPQIEGLGVKFTLVLTRDSNQLRCTAELSSDTPRYHVLLPEGSRTAGPSCEDIVEFTRTNPQKLLKEAGLRLESAIAKHLSDLDQSTVRIKHLDRPRNSLDFSFELRRGPYLLGTVRFIVPDREAVEFFKYQVPEAVE